VRLLLSNDDGIDAPGIVALADGLDAAHEVWVVAPATERSAMSHSLTMHKPLRASPRGERRWAISGTPADCIYVAVHHLMVDRPPELVLSGVNRGSNLGSDVHYSGTVAAAREACLHGFPSVALSLHGVADAAEVHWETAVAIGERLVEAVSADPLPRGVFVNVNVPNLPLDRLRGLKACRLGERVYGPLVDERLDPRGKPYLWIGGPHLNFGEDPDADGPSVEAGWATVTPVSAEITWVPSMPQVRRWTDA
jgi:5'-nucleotidase